MKIEVKCVCGDQLNVEGDYTEAANTMASFLDDHVNCKPRVVVDRERVTGKPEGVGEPGRKMPKPTFDYFGPQPIDYKPMPCSKHGGNGEADAMKIIPNPQNNAVLIYATPQEEGTVEAMLRKVDILPLQVRIDATIAEVQLNDTLQYGTQYFFKSGSLNLALSAASNALPGSGFVLGSSGTNGSAALAALQAVTTVNVLSSPELLVLDNQTAQLQVGAMVPYLSQSSQSTVSSNAPVINSIQYQQTGVIMNVTPRVNSGGLVTLDIAQEVSDVNNAVTTAGINSPTFNERRVTSRVVVQDGQTIGLAGLINDNSSRSNSGIPWLKDVPLLGALVSQQDNTRSRTELLILITPHVIHDQRDARAFTEDLREQLPNAAAVPTVMKNTPMSGSADPNAALRRKLKLEQ